MSETLAEIHKAFINFTKRAEKSTADVLTRTFVDSAPLMDSLSSSNNQVMYGRRGTGKTHAFKYLSKSLEAQSSKHPIYIDLRSIGSDGALYHDTTRPTQERSIRLIFDVLRVVADELYSIAVEKISTSPHPEQITSRLDDLVAAISQVKVVGELTTEQRDLNESKQSKSRTLQLDAVTGKSGTSYKSNAERGGTATTETKLIAKGQEQYHIDFGRVQGSLSSLIGVLGQPQIWLLVDEWSELPIDLQPYLADLLRRTVLPLERFVVKIAAIEHRSRFYIQKADGEYLGLELGADISADVNLDDFLVFDNSQNRSVEFFKQLLFQHYQASSEAPSIGSADELIRIAFTQTPVFDEFVRAVEGVPRDALNLAAKLASKAYGRQAAMTDVRAVARDWYQQDKASVLKSSPALNRLMGHVVDTVIGTRRARAFLFSNGGRNQHIERLFDSRIIHLLKKNVSSKEEPGKRYDVYKIDYGCYVDLINTQKAPKGLFDIAPEDASESTFVEVPSDDYRSIRRAILTEADIAEFSGDTQVAGDTTATSDLVVSPDKD
jgi:hypothetical protein